MNKAKALLIMEFSASITLTEDIIIAKYKTLAKKYHPDINKASNAHEKFISIQDAKDFLIEDLKNPYKERFDQRSYTRYQSYGFDPYEQFKTYQEAFRKAKEELRKPPYFKYYKNRNEFNSDGSLTLYFEVFKINNIIINNKNYDLSYNAFNKVFYAKLDVPYDKLIDNNYHLIIDFIAINGKRTRKIYKINEDLIQHPKKPWWDVF